MNKEDLIEKIESNNQINLSRKKIRKSVNCILDAITEKLREGGRVELRGFGAFTKKTYLRENNRNPKTGEILPPKKIVDVRFRAGKLMKENVDYDKNKH